MKTRCLHQSQLRWRGRGEGIPDDVIVQFEDKCGTRWTDDGPGEATEFPV